MAMMKRLNWLKWLRPGQTELQSEQGYWNTKRKRHLMDEHGSGIVSGCEVLASSVPDLEVHVQVGRVLDPAGNDAVIESIQDLDLSSYAAGGGVAYIVVLFSETATDPYFVTQIGSSQSKYYQETVTVSHQATPATGNQIELARVSVSNGATFISNAEDPLMPIADEINHLNRVISQVQMSGAPLGYKVLDPANGSVQEQLAKLGVQSGDRFWLRSGTYLLSGLPLILSVDDVFIEGSRDAVISMTDTYEYIQVTGFRNRLRGFTVTHVDVPASLNGGIISTDVVEAARPVLEDLSVQWGGVASDEMWAIAVDGGAADVVRCDINPAGTARGVYVGGSNSRVLECNINGRVELYGSNNSLLMSRVVLDEDDTFTGTVQVGGSGGSHHIEGCHLERQQSTNGVGAVIRAIPLSSVDDVVVLGNRLVPSEYGPAIIGAAGCDGWTVKGNEGVENHLSGPNVGYRVNTAYTVGDEVMPNAFRYNDSSKLLRVVNGIALRCVVSGTSSNQTVYITPIPLLWPEIIGQTLVDNTVTWLTFAVPGSVCTNGSSGWEFDFPAMRLVNTGSAGSGDASHPAVARQAPFDATVVMMGESTDHIWFHGRADYDPTPVHVRGIGMGGQASAASYAGMTMGVKGGEYFQVDYHFDVGSSGWAFVVTPWG